MQCSTVRNHQYSPHILRSSEANTEIRWKELYLLNWLLIQNEREKQSMYLFGWLQVHFGQVICVLPISSKPPVEHRRQCHSCYGTTITCLRKCHRSNHKRCRNRFLFWLNYLYFLQRTKLRWPSLFDKN